MKIIKIFGRNCALLGNNHYISPNNQKSANMALSAYMEKLGREVDVVEDGYLYPYAEETANRDKILIYERETERQRTA